jgi:hypothetical protein
MSKVVVFTNLALDGVMQAPGRPDEDRRGGFEHGGWATPYAAMAQAGDGKTTSEGLVIATYRPAEPKPFMFTDKTEGLHGSSR